MIMMPTLIDLGSHNTEQEYHEGLTLMPQSILVDQDSA